MVVVRSAAALLGYALAAVVFMWPLAAHISTRMTGPVDGDTGVYVWNMWVFRHEIVAHRQLPLFTSKILALTPPTDLSLHNYTIFQDLLAFPLLPIAGVASTFNIIQLAMMMLTGFATYLLAKNVTGRDVEAWLAGLLFAFAPTMIAKSTGHFSLLAAAPLAFFLLALLRVERTGRIADAALAGLVVAWAAVSDAYYGIYCVLLFGVFAAARLVRIERHAPPLRAARTLDVLMIGLAGLTAGIMISGGGRVQLPGLTVSMRSVYTPVLLLTAAAVARVVLVLRPHIAWSLVDPKPLVRLMLVAGLVCATALSPVLYALGHRLAEGDRLLENVPWRSTPPGVDLIAWVLPNPSHPLAGSGWREWLTRERPDAFPEQTASLPYIALGVVLLAAWRRRERLPALWVAMTLAFGLLALGPFIRVAGFNTYVPGPWALLRFVPIVGSARMPSRFVVPATLGFAVLFAICLTRLAEGRQRRAALAVAGAVLVFELWPAPRELHSTAVPGIYRVVRDDPRNIRVLELPFGIRDGTMSAGNFNAGSQYVQTYHEKALIGGYLSRIPASEVARYREFPVLAALLDLSEGAPLEPAAEQAARAGAQALVERVRMGYVIIDSHRASQDLREFAVKAFGLVKIAEADGRELYRPEPGPSVNQPDHTPLNEL